MLRNRSRRAAAALLVATLLAGLASGQPPGSSRPSPRAEAVLGFWRGEAAMPGGPIEVSVEISRGIGGRFQTRITLPKLGWLAREATSRFDDAKLVIDAAGVSYSGAPSADESRISGAWSGPGWSVPLEFTRVTNFPGHRQEPKRPFPYREEEVSFANAKARITFHGTLTLPSTPGPHPAVVMITGFGCQNRDEMAGGHRPYLVIADRLTRRGVAVLRYDDRGFGDTAGNVLDATSEDNASDALAGAAYLATRSDIERARIGLVGKSEGGLIVFMAAARAPWIRCIVSMAPITEKCEDRGYEMLLQLADLEHAPAALRIAGKALIKPTLAIIKSDQSDAEVRAKLATFLPPALVGYATCRWARFIVRYDPAVAIDKVRCPILALFCAEDTQLPARPQVEALRAATARSGNPDVTIVTYPRLGHMFQLQRTTPADGLRADETIDSEALDRLTGWVAEKLAARSPESR